MDRQRRAIVIGSGVGGLAVAARLCAAGWSVTILEKNEDVGGRAATFEQDGFTLDAGPAMIAAPHILETLWRDCGFSFADDVTLRPCEPHYRIRFNDGSTFAVRRDPERMRAEVSRIAPGDIAGYDRFVADSSEIFRVAFAEVADIPFHRFGTTLRRAGELLRVGGHRTVYAKVCQYVSDPKLRIALSVPPLLVGGTPFATTAYYCLVAHLERAFGVHGVVGGTGALVAAMARLVTRQGGTIRTGAMVTRILTDGGRVTGVVLKGGEALTADIVVSNADAAMTYHALLGGVSRRRWSDAKLARAHHSMSFFVWSFGTKRTFPNVGAHTLLPGQRYKAFFDDIGRAARLPDDLLLYLHRATFLTPDLAPEGCDAFYAASVVPNLSSGTDWPSIAEAYRQKIESRLAQTVLPGLGEAVVTSRVFTPADFRDRLFSYQGAAFALEPRLFQTAWFRPHNVSEEVDGLYLVGAGTHPGAGLPGVVSSAKIVADLVARR